MLFRIFKKIKISERVEGESACSAGVLITLVGCYITPLLLSPYPKSRILG